jgi:hypothetical protein
MLAELSPGTMQGFIVMHLEPKLSTQFYAEMTPKIVSGKIQYREHIYDGLANAGEAGGVGNARSSVEESSDSSAGTGDAVQNGNQEVVVYALKVRLNVFNRLYLSAAGKLILGLFC